MTASRQAAVTRMATRLWWLPLAPIGFLADRGSRWRWASMPGVVIATTLASSAGKLVVRRPRPGAACSVAPWGRLGIAGFPSTHTACAFAVAGWLRASRRGRWLHAVAVLIGYSRVRRRAHYLSDVLSGAMLGHAVARQLDRAWRSLDAARRSARPTPDRVIDPVEEHLARARLDGLDETSIALGLPEPARLPGRFRPRKKPTDDLLRHARSRSAFMLSRSASEF